MGSFIIILNSSTYFLSSVLLDILVIDINKSIPNTVISFSIYSKDINAMLETINLGLVVVGK